MKITLNYREWFGERFVSLSSLNSWAVETKADLNQMESMTAREKAIACAVIDTMVSDVVVTGATAVMRYNF